MRTEYQLKPKELAEIEKAIRQDKRAEVKQRAAVIRLLHLGHKPDVVAAQQMVSVPTVYNWHKLWREKGLEGLANKARPGRKPKATDAYCLKKETGIHLSEVRFRALLKKKGYRYRRPKHDLSHLQDKVAKKKAEKLLEEMKKRASETISNSSLWTKSA